MKVFFTFLFMFLVSAGITFFLTHKPEDEKKQIVRPFSVSSFSMEDAPSDALKGKIASMSGEVLWQSRVASEPARLDQPQEILQGENIVTRNTGSVALNFNDAAIITIDPDSELDIVQTLPANLVMTQKSGSILYQKPGIVPVSVKTGGLLVNQEEGTMRITFDVQQATVTVNVTEGKARVAHTDEEDTSVVREVTSGDSFVYEL